jgi:hypothetical protein
MSCDLSSLGTLGKTATHCVVMARLITQDTDHGTHAFIVQLRDLETHKVSNSLLCSLFLALRVCAFVCAE